MTDERDQRHASDRDADEAPGESPNLGNSLRKLAFGLGGSVLLTLASFWAAGTGAVWSPAVPVLLAALAIGQMGIHLVFFLHVSSGPEAVNNVLALAFGVFVVALVVFGSIIIVSDLDSNMMPMTGSAPAASMSMPMPSAAR